MNLVNFSIIKSILLSNKGVRQTLFKNTFWLTVSEIFSKVASYVIIILIARYFGPTIYGKFAFSLSFVSLFTILTDWGFNVLSVREIARDKTKTTQYIDNILAIKFILGVITFFLFFLAIIFSGKETDVVILVCILGAYNLINSFNFFFYSIFQANERMEYETFVKVIQQFSLILLAILFVFLRGSILMIGFSYVFSALSAFVICLLFLWKYFSRILLKIDFKICKEILKESWPFGLTAIFGIVYHQIDSVILSFMKDYTAVGWYNVAQKLPNALLLFPMILNGAVFPKMSHFHASSKDSLKKLFFKYFKYSSVLGILLGLFTTVFAKQIIYVFFGSQFLPAVLALQITIWSTVLIFINSAFIKLFEASNRQLIITKICFLGAVLNLSLNFLLIPKYSYIGSSIAIVASELLITLLVITLGVKILKKT